jgi:ketosteroid isomerase-like protein
VADSRGYAETIRDAYRLWSDTRGGSAAMWLEMFADDIVIRSLAGGHAALGFARGRGDAERYFAELAASWEIVSFDVQEILADGDWVVVLSQVACRSKATGKVAESPKADVFRFRDGKVVEFLEFFDTAAALAATQPGG